MYKWLVGETEIAPNADPCIECGEYGSDVSTCIVCGCDGCEHCLEDIANSDNKRHKLCGKDT